VATGGAFFRNKAARAKFKKGWSYTSMPINAFMV